MRNQKKDKKIRKRTKRLIAGFAAASVLAGCGGEADQWKEAPGTKGRINMDAVKTAFQLNPTVEGFEKRINEIYEGDNIVLLSSKNCEPPVTKGFECKAYEDIDKDKSVSEGDDLLFTLTVADGMVTLKGAGANSYYSQTWPYRPQEETHSSYRRHHHGLLFYHWYGRGISSYYSSSPRYNSLQADRNAYRNSSAFKQQVARNSAYETRASAAYGAQFRKSGTSLSSTRQNYISNGVKTQSYAKSSSNSGWKTRAASGVRSSGSSSRGFGGFRGSSGIRVG